MKPVLVGSRALAVWYPQFKPREDSDWDFIADDTSVVDHLSKIDTSSFSSLNNKELCQLFKVTRDDLPYDIMGPIGLGVMKRSHLWRNHFFEKHINQYHTYLKRHTPPINYRLLEDRTKLTKEAYPQSNPKLNQTNEDFFDDAVKKEYDHDYLHELYAYGKRPMYEKLKDDLSKAWCQKQKWEKLTSLQKKKCVAEECMVIATERFLIPKQWKFPPKRAYLEAMHKVCTTLCSGWFRDFAIDHYPEILNMYDEKKFNKVKGKLT